MLDFQLFRVKVYPSPQRLLFQGEITRQEALRRSLCSLPQVELRTGRVWHIGNVREIDKAGLYFRIGRTSRSTVGVYEEGNSTDQEFETAPYSHVMLDVELEISAIAKKTQLAPKPSGIANQLARLLNHSGPARELGFSVEVDEISDPEDFVTYLREADAIPKFWMTFSRPNAIDANKDFVQPFQKFLAESNGERGKAELQGGALEPGLLEELARSAAATGNDAGATMIRATEERKIRKRLRGNTVNIEEEDLTDDQGLTRLLNHVKEAYKRIRGKAGER
jgi:hypothetical protein